MFAHRGGRVRPGKRRRERRAAAAVPGGSCRPARPPARGRLRRRSCLRLRRLQPFLRTGSVRVLVAARAARCPSQPPLESGPDHCPLTFQAPRRLPDSSVTPPGRRSGDPVARRSPAPRRRRPRPRCRRGLGPAPACVLTHEAQALSLATRER